MAVVSSLDMASFMDDWGEDFVWKGRTIQGDFSEGDGEAFGVRGTVPMVRFLVSSSVPLEEGDTLVRASNSKVYTIGDLYQDDKALGAPAWRVILVEQ